MNDESAIIHCEFRARMITYKPLQIFGAVDDFEFASQGALCARYRNSYQTLLSTLFPHFQTSWKPRPLKARSLKQGGEDGQTSKHNGTPLLLSTWLKVYGPSTPHTGYFLPQKVDNHINFALASGNGSVVNLTSWPTGRHFKTGNGTALLQAWDVHWTR